MSDQNKVLNALCGAGHVLVAVPETAVAMVIQAWNAAGHLSRLIIHSENCPVCDEAAAPGSWDSDAGRTRSGQYSGQLVPTGEIEEVA